ncbi:MAG: methylated-DNA--[protein]-cysteine S-methyltransferase [Bdellovibrionales bacterium]
MKSQKKKQIDKQNLFYDFIDSSIGVVAFAWSSKGLKAVQLPEKTSRATIQKLLNRFPEATLTQKSNDPLAKDLRKKVQNLLAGKPESFSSIPLDIYSSPFHKKVYEVLKKVKPGQVLTYKELATQAGSPLASRAVGQAMARNPVPLVIPCHRVMGSQGSLTGFTAADGVKLKSTLLRLEKAQIV